MSQGFTKDIPIDTDGTLSANSDFVVPSQKAVKTYVDTEIASIVTGLSDGDYGDVVVSSSGTVITLKPSANRLFNFMNLK